MDSNRYESIVGRYFECADDPPRELSKCPAMSRLPGYNGPLFDANTGEWTCPLCLSVVKRDNEEDEEEMFDDDEEAAFDNDEDYIAEGDRIQDQTDEQSIRVTRDRAIEEMAEAITPINPSFGKALILNRYSIIDHLRILEEAQETLFETGTGKPVKPKVLAVAIYLTKIPLPPTQLRLLGVSQGAVQSRLKILSSLSTNDTGLSPIVEQMYYVGKSVGISKVVVDIMVEQYEEIGGLPNREPDETTRAAAWIYLKAKDSGIKGITKTKLKSVPSVKSNALDRAIDSYKVNLQNRIKPVEGVLLSDDD